MPHQLLDSRKIIREQLSGKLKIGKVSISDLVELSPIQMLVLYEIFFEDFSGEKILFPEEFLPSNKSRLICCIPSSESIHRKVADSFVIDSRIKLDKLNGQRSYMRGRDYVISIPISSMEINSGKCVKNRQLQFMTLQETQIFELFLRWLSCLELLVSDFNSMLVTSSHDVKGQFMILDCLNSEVYGHKFANSDGSKNPTGAGVFRVRNVICKRNMLKDEEVFGE